MNNAFLSSPLTAAATFATIPALSSQLPSDSHMDVHAVGHWALMWPRIKLHTDTSGQTILALNFTWFVKCPPSRMVQLIAAAVMAAALALHVWSCETLGKVISDQTVLPLCILFDGLFAAAQFAK